MKQMTLFGHALPDLPPPPVPKRRAPMQAAANDTANDKDIDIDHQAPAASGSLPPPTGEEDAAQPGTDSEGGCSSGNQTPPASEKLPPLKADEAEAPPAKLAQRSQAWEVTEPAFDSPAGSEPAFDSISNLANIFTTAGVMVPMMPLGTPICKKNAT
jgi:hypothetical protein